MGPAVRVCVRVPRPGRKTAARRHAVRELRKRRVHLHGLFLVSTAAGGRARRLPHLRKHDQRRKGFPSMIPVPPEDEPPPFLGSWRRVYTVVLAYLACVIVAFYVFTRIFS